MATYEYVDKGGKLRTIEAFSPDEAMRKAPDIGRTSGVALSTGQNGRRNLQLSSGDNAASLMQTGAASGQVANTADPYAKFNEGLMQLLTRHQTMGTKRFQEQGFNAQAEQNKRVSAKTPKDLIGASPGVQNSVRSASAGALDPTIDQARNAQQTFGEQVNSYGDAIKTAQDFIKEARTSEEKLKKDAQDQIEFALMRGADSLNDLPPEDLAELEKRAGFPKGYVANIARILKAKETRDIEEFDRLHPNPGGSGGGSPIEPGSPTDTSTKGTQAAKTEVESVFRAGLKNDAGEVVFNGRGSDGYVDPGAYIYAYNNWPGTKAQFLSAFPVKTHVNPASYGLLPAAIPRPTAAKGRTR